MGKDKKPRPGAIDADRSTNTTAHVQVLGLGLDVEDASPSVLLFFDRARYLFNVGEGFQRYCVENRQKLSKLNHIFLTRISHETANGLPGLLLTVADAATASNAPPVEIDLFGPPRILGLKAALDTLVQDRHVAVTPKPFGAGAPGWQPEPASGFGLVHQDDLVTVRALCLHPAASDGEAGVTPVATVAPEAAAGKKRAREEDDGDGASEGAHTSAAAEQQFESTLYLCELRDIPGKFDPQRAAALGLPKGPLFGRLVKGETVRTPDGRTVAPADVVGAATPGPSLLVADLPSLRHLRAALAAPAPAPANGSALTVALHLAPPAVAAAPQFRAWLARFGAATRHVLVNADAAGGEPVFRSSAALSTKLSLLHDGIFPPMQLSAAQPAATPAGATPGANGLKFGLRPLALQGLDASALRPALSASAIAAEVAAATPLALSLASAAREAALAPAAAGALPECLRGAARGSEAAPELLFLGTGAAVPSKYRNVSSILLRVPSRGELLMDAGEGTLGQLRRRLGRAGADAALRGLRLAWISHIHADHHVGLVSILCARRALLGPGAPPLLVCGPWPLQRWLDTYESRVEPLGFRFVNLTETTERKMAEAAAGRGPAAAQQLARVARGELGLGRLFSVPVIHCAHSYGLVAQGEATGWKVVYSGDTRPCDALVEAARGATVLVHEATFEDALAEEAVAKRHSLTREAVAAGAAAGAYRTLLTHFSQRYPKIPVIDASYTGSTAIAFDGMCVSLADLPALPGLLPALQALLVTADDEESAEEIDIHKE